MKWESGRRGPAAATGCAIRFPAHRGKRAWPASPRLGQAARLVLLGEGVDDLVEVAGEHLVELVDGQPDAVVGDPVLLVVVGADLLGALPRRRSGTAAVGGLRRLLALLLDLSRRARSTRRAFALFWSWLFSSCIVTTTPVGRWVMRTAESVVLTDCRPGPSSGRRRSAGRSGRSGRRPRRPRAAPRRWRRGVDAALALGDGHPLHPVGPALVLHAGLHPVAP